MTTSDAEPAVEPEGPGSAFAWRVHDAIETWIGKVDAKASIILALQSAYLAGLIAMTDDGRRLDGLTGWSSCARNAAVVTLMFALASSAAAVFPQLRGRKAKREATTGFVYFGHLRLREPKDVAAALRSLSEEKRLDVLSRQMVRTSEISWRKHRWLQVSMLLTAASALIVAVLLGW